MDLLGKTIVAAVIVIAILIVLYFALKSFSPVQSISEGQAVALVESDLINSNPGGIVNVTSVSPSQYPGSWHIVVSLVLKPTSPCPTYVVYSYDYPRYGLISRTENIYTSNCTIYGMQNGSYIIASFPVAITRSYDLNVPQVNAFINDYGFDNVSTHASFFSNITEFGKNYTNVWLVTYSSARSNHTVNVLLSQVGGNPLLTYNSS